METEKSKTDRLHFLFGRSLRQKNLKALRASLDKKVKALKLKAEVKIKENNEKINAKSVKIKKPSDKNFYLNKGRDYALLKKFKITKEDYQKLLDKQGGVCAICGKTQKQQNSRFMFLAVDHDHKCCPEKQTCGKCIRGLLCNKCNTGLANFDDDLELFKKAIKYLQLNEFDKEV
jgi:hypothetical protein